MFGRRLLLLLVILAAAGVPAGVLRATCAGNSCRNLDAGPARVPFCPLPQALKATIAAGYREGRSPDVLAVTATATVVTGGTDANDATAPWIARDGASSTGVPILFAGTGVARDAVVPDGTGLDQIAPTIAEAIGFDRPFPNVRAGVAVPGVASGDRPRLVLEIALKGIGSADLEANQGSWPFLRSLMNDGAGTVRGDTGSLPLDPAATLTTIGTGGPPSQHGITGTLLRNDDGEVVRAWGKGSPPSIIATLPDDLDQAMGERSLIGLVASDLADRGIVGGTWYPDHDRDLVVVSRWPEWVGTAEQMLRAGFGADDVTDVLAVVLDSSAGSRDGAMKRLVGTAERVSGGSLLVVVAGTGSATGTAADPTAASEVVSRVEDSVPGDASVVTGAVPGGLFLNQGTLAAEGITGQAAVDALLEVKGPDGRTMMADAFQGFAVSFARYC